MDVIPGETLEQHLARCSDHYQATMAAAVAVVETVAETMEVNQEQAAELPGERFEQFTLDKPRIDKDKGEMYGVRVMGIKSTHGYEYTLEAHRAASSHFEQMAVGIDHDYDGGPLTADKAWAVFHNVRVDERGTLADLRYLKTHQRTEQILEDVERDLGIFSMSPVTQRCVERPKGSVVSFVPVRCDLVVRGATTRKLFEQAPTTPAPPAVDPAELAALKAEVAALKIQTAKFEQFTQARSTMQQNIERTEAKVFGPMTDEERKKFWNE